MTEIKQTSCNTIINRIFYLGLLLHPYMAMAAMGGCSCCSRGGGRGWTDLVGWRRHVAAQLAACHARNKGSSDSWPGQAGSRRRPCLSLARGGQGARAQRALAMGAAWVSSDGGVRHGRRLRDGWRRRTDERPWRWSPERSPENKKQQGNGQPIMDSIKGIHYGVENDEIYLVVAVVDAET